MEVKLLGDHDKEDILGTTPLAQTVASLIDNSVNSLPFTIGIEGAYGSGKTTVLKQIEEELRKRKYLTISFNPWQYTDPNVLQSSLMSRFISKILPVREIYLHHKRTKWKILSIVLSTISSRFLKVDLAEKIAKSFEVSPRFKDEFTENFVPAIENQLNKKNSPIKGVIVLVDDVDRCYPKSVLGLLESIMLFYNLEKVGFILSYDQMILTRVVVAELKDYIFDPTRYLKKFVQIQLNIADYRKKKIDDYIQRCLDKSGLTKFMGEVSHDVIKKGTQDNPREIKTLLNTLVTDVSELPTMENEKIGDIVIIRLLGLRWPVVHRRLLRDEDYRERTFTAIKDGDDDTLKKMATEMLTHNELANELVDFLKITMALWTSGDYINKCKLISSQITRPLAAPEPVYRDIKQRVEHKELGIVTLNSAVLTEQRMVSMKSAEYLKTTINEELPYWDWSIWIEPMTDSGSIYPRIASVVYHLHSTFPTPDRKKTNKDDNFLMETRGWGTFMVKIDLFDREEKILGTVYHDLLFWDEASGVSA